MVNKILLAAVLAFALASGLLLKMYRSQVERVGQISSTLVLEQKKTEELTQYVQVLKEQAERSAELDRKYLQQLSDAEAENQRLADAVRDGNQRLRVKAECVPDTTSTSGMDDAGAAELTAAARQDYFALRSQIVSTEAALSGLQDWVNTFCK